MIEVHKMEMKMYANMQVFQQLSAWIMAQHSRSQDKNTHFTTIREGMNEMQKWIKENHHAPLEFPCITEWERNLNHDALDNCLQAEEKIEELRNSLSIYTQLHKAAHILAQKLYLPQIEELGNLNTDE